MTIKWSAGIDFDQKRLGYGAIYGLKNREEAIEWVRRASADCRLYMQPSCWIKETKRLKACNNT